MESLSLGAWNIRDAGKNVVRSTISLDWSHIGMSVGLELARRHLIELAKEASVTGLTIMISMEESAKTDKILSVYKAVSEGHPNVGITLQAHLYRTVRDWNDIARYPGRVRIVQGASGTPNGRSSEVRRAGCGVSPTRRDGAISQSSTVDCNTR